MGPLRGALSAPFPIMRDGAGLGLARLGDPDALPHVRRAIERERDLQIREDPILVADELGIADERLSYEASVKESGRSRIG